MQFKFEKCKEINLDSQTLYFFLAWSKNKKYFFIVTDYSLQICKGEIKSKMLQHH